MLKVAFSVLLIRTQMVSRSEHSSQEMTVSAYYLPDLHSMPVKIQGVI